MAATAPAPDETTFEALHPEGHHDPGLNLHARMLLVMKHIGFIPKTGTGPESQGSYAFARVEIIKDRVRDELVAHGVMPHASFSGRDIQVLNGTDRNGNARTSILATVWGTMTFVNVDDPDDRFEVAMHGQGIDSQDKAVSKATTSADKYALLNAFQIPTGKDPDEEGEDVPTGQRQQPRQQAPRQPAGNGGDPRDAGWDGGGYVDNDGTTGAHDDGYRHQQQQPRQQQRYPSAAPSPGGKCPKHNRPWKSGQYGWFCSAKDDSTEKGYCNLKPEPGWVQSQER